MAIKNLLNQLIEDKWRRDNPFAEHITIANKVLLDPFSTQEEKEEAIGPWLQRHQPCVFGKLAAQKRRIYYCILTEADLREPNTVIQGKINRARKTWKQLALNGKNYSAHSFFVLVCSERVLRAAPDNNLKAFALALQSLLTTTKEADEYGNDRAFQYVYLKNPKDGQFYKFMVIMDFFAAVGDGRWWMDHRTPGGLAFSLNSLGHMVRTQEWYGGESDRHAWATKLAMTTIDSAETHTKHGKATWLVDLENGKPLKSVGCPFANPESIPAKLKGKDWTTYEGFHHTDHSVRAEFFVEKDSVPTASKPYRMDFSYIFSRNKGENSELMDGVPVTEDEVYKDIDRPEDWRIAPPARQRAVDRPEEVVARINLALKECRRWEMSDHELKSIVG